MVFPFATSRGGWYQDTSFVNVGSLGYYWTSTYYDSTSTKYFSFVVNSAVVSNNLRRLGISICFIYSDQIFQQEVTDKMQSYLMLTSMGIIYLSQIVILIDHGILDLILTGCT